METLEYNGFKIVVNDVGGKGGKNPVTRSIQVRKYLSKGFYVLKSFQFKVGDVDAKNRAIEKAKNYCNININKNYI